VGDDIIDIFGEEEKTGKKVGGDIYEHKLGNVVLLLALEELGAPLAEVLAKSVVTPEDVARAIDLIRRTSARQRAEELRNRYVERALAALERLPGSPYRDFLRDLAIFIREREF